MTIKKPLLIISLGLLGAACLSFSVSARTDWSNRDTSFYDHKDGDSGYGYSRTLSGATWVYYKIDQGYNKESTINVPLDKEHALSTSPVSVGTCALYGGFWALMLNEYKQEGTDSESGTAVQLTGGLAGAASLKDILYTAKDSSEAPSITGTENYISYFSPSKLDKLLSTTNAKPTDSSTIPGISVEKYGDMSEVYSAYQKVLAGSSDGIPTDAGGTVYGWGGNSALSYFCAGPDSSQPLKNIEDENMRKTFDTFSTVEISSSYTSAPVLNGASYIGHRELTEDGQKNIINSLIVPRGSTIDSITFHHYLAKTATSPVNGSIRANSITRTIQRGDGPIEELSIGGRELAADNQLSSRFNIYNTDYYPVIDISEALNSEVISDVTTFCETIVFQRSSYLAHLSSSNNAKITEESGEVSSSACVTFFPMEDPSDYRDNQTIVQSCTQGGQNGNGQGGDVAYVYRGTNDTAFFGNTIATVGLAVDGKLQTTSAAVRSSAADPNSPLYQGSTITAYAKPGDTVQFSYGICFGAQSTFWSILNENEHENGNRVVGSFDIHIGASDYDEEQSAFLFGRDSAILGHGEISINNTVARNQGLNIQEGVFYYDGSIQNSMAPSDVGYLKIDPNRRELLLSSPDVEKKDMSTGGSPVIAGSEEAEENSLDRYSCNDYLGINPPRDNLSAGGYRIPGFQSPHGGCRSSELQTTGKGGSSKDMPSIVGTSLSQTLRYNATMVWPTVLSKAGAANERFDNNCQYSVPGSIAPDTDQSKATNCEYHTEVGLDHAAADFDRAYELYEKGYRPSETEKVVGVYTNDSVYKTATVKIPYNFDTAISMELKNPGSIIYAGDKLSISANVDILPRINPLTSDIDADGKKVPYATITPPDTNVQLIQLIVPSDSSLKEHKILKGGDIGPSEFKGSDFCNYLLGTVLNNASGSDCWTDIVKGAGAENDAEIGNNDSNPEGEMGYYHEDNITRTVPDIEAGYKYCVALAISHGDSHGVAVDKNDPNGGLSTDPAAPNFGANAQSTNNALDNFVQYNWRTTPLSCRTIAKKPSFEVWNSGVYSGGDIDTAITNKAVNAKLGYSEEKVKETSPEYKYFGSWAEYFVVSKGTVRNFASASALGFNNSITWVWKDPILMAELDSEGNPKQAIDENGKLAWYGTYYNQEKQPYIWSEYLEYDSSTRVFKGKNGKTKSISSVASGNTINNYCELSQLTIANVFCKDGKSGEYASSNGTTDNTSMLSYKKRILDYYTNDELTSGDGVITGNNGTYSQDKNKTTKQNGADYLKIFGNYTIDEPIVRDTGTLVIQVKGHLDIKKNICLGSEGSCANTTYNYRNPAEYRTWEQIAAISDANLNTLDGQAAFARAVYQFFQGETIKDGSNNLSLEYRNEQKILAGELSSIPQVLIIAESISISSEVSQIDAWLITDSGQPIDNFYDGGYINTCSEFVDGKSGADSCWRTLKVNGPVFTSALLLNRTGGSWPGLTSDVGNPIYDVLRKVYDKFYEVWDTDAENECSAHPTQKSFCKSSRIGASKRDFLNTLRGNVGESQEVAPENERIARAYEAVNFYSADSNSVSSGRSNSRDLTCDGSITPAEIFDLNPMVFYWSYGQSQGAAEAIITYAQELAPRY